MSDDYLRKCCKSEGHGVLLKSVTSEYKLYAFPPPRANPKYATA